jgi:hypothetical protein
MGWACMTQTEDDGALTPYESPRVTLVGAVTDLTLAKPGIFFDFPGSTEGNATPPAPGAPGTTS